MKKLALAALCVCLSGCLGYHIGEVKPFYLKDVKDIAVPTFKNDTLIPHIDSLVTDTVIKQFQQDGTYKIVNESGADGILKAEITRITRTPARSLVGNVLATTEFNLSIHVRYHLAGRSGGTALPGPGSDRHNEFLRRDGRDHRRAPGTAPGDGGTCDSNC